MRTILTALLLLPVLMALTVADKPDTVYYIGKTKVGEALWRSLPDSMIHIKEHRESDSMIIESINLAMEYELDSLSELGTIAVVRRPEEKIALIRSLMRETMKRGEILKVGDRTPQFTLIKNPGGARVEDAIKPGKCYLINFWATWCGNCLQELRPDELPAIAERYIDCKHFVFMPVCIDSTIADLQKFFDSEYGKSWNFLRYVTYIDIDRMANSLFAKAGIMPLTVVAGADGTIKYIHTGRLVTQADYDALQQAIDEGLAAAE